MTLAPGETLSVVFKRLLPDPDPVVNTYLREVLIYRRLLAGERFGAPALYASVHDEARERFWLFVEDLGDSTLEDGDVEDWLSAARWLAALHGSYSGREDELRSLGCLGEHGLRFYRTLAAKARQNLTLAGAAEALARFEELMSGYESIVAELVGRPRTLVHGDLGPHNLALQPGGRIRPVDWGRRSGRARGTSRGCCTTAGPGAQSSSRHTSRSSAAVEPSRWTVRRWRTP